MKDYTPNPIDTSNIELPESLLPLMEKLAVNSHDVWAAKRTEDGWTYGPSRDDYKKTHPCLIAYEELPESEKEYDRKIAAETLKVVIGLGYRIEAPT